MRWLGILLILFSIEAYGQSTCPAVLRSSSQDIQNSAKDILKTTNLQYARSDMKDFCKRNLFLRYLNTKDNPPPNCEKLPLDQLEKLVNETTSKSKIDKSTWAKSLLGTHSAIEEVKNDFYPEFEKLTEKKISESAKAREKIESIKKTGAQADFSEAAAMYPAVCLKDAPFHLQSCIKGMKIIEAEMKPTYSFTNMDVWAEIYKGNKYDEGLRLAALKLKSRVDGNITRDSNIFDDIRSGFVASGLSPSDAIDATWKTLAVISNGGQNTSARTDAIDPDWTLQKSVALNVISASMSFLDMKKEDKGWPLYSFPKDVKTSCNTQKPYHFWMSGYLARKLKAEGIDTETAEKAVFLSHQGYQLKRNATGAALTTNAILTREPFDPAHQIVRTDLAFSAAGAVYGAENFDKNSSRKVNVDSAVISLLEESSVEKSLEKKEAERMNLASSYFRWTKIFAPEAALKAVKENRN